MNILHLTTYYRPDIGGIAEHVYNLNLHLRKEGINSSVLHIMENSKKDGFETISSSEFRLHLTNNLEDLRKILKAKHLRKLIEEKFPSVDLIHVHTFNRLEFIPWMWKNWVWTAHLSFLPDISSSKKLKDILLRILFRHVFKDAKAIIGVSSHQVSFIEKLTGRKDIYIIPNGVDIEKFKRGNVKPLINKPDNSVVILCPSMWKRVKGIDILLRSIAYIKQHYPEKYRKIILLMVQSNHEPIYRDYINKMLKEFDLKNKVILLNPLNPDSMPSLYASGDIVVVPSRYESFGISILEAMAMGKAVIASKTGGIVDIIQDGQSGILFPVEDHIALARRIIYLMDNQEVLKKIQEYARKRAEDFSWNRVTKQLIGIYEKSL